LLTIDAMDSRRAIVVGALLIVASELMFASMGAIVKHLSGAGMRSEIMVFMRNFFGVMVILPLLLRHGMRNFGTTVPHLHLLRAVAGVGAMYSFYYVLGRLALADSMLLKLTTPIFLPLVAFVWLRESISRWALLAVPVGFAGVILILNPTGHWQWVALIGLLGGLLAAIAKVTVRRLGRTEPATRIVFYFAVMGGLVSLLPLTWSWHMPTSHQWGWLVSLGVVGTAGQLLLTRGYTIARAGNVGPFTYFSVVFAAIYGFVFWGETVDGMFIAGALLVMLAGLMVLNTRRVPPLAVTDVD
jgi:drug/metabolite transporter (DMT)-like permease